MIYSVNGKRVTFAGESFIAPNATVIGDVSLGSEVSVWFNAVVRGDSDSIHIGERSNIQDGAVLHVDPDYPLEIGQQVTVGHKAMLHGCTVGDCSLIGINAVVLNGAKIGKHCLIGANALVPENMEVPNRSLVLGSPAKIKRQLSDEQCAALERSAQAYVDKAKQYRETLKRNE